MQNLFESSEAVERGTVWKGEGKQAGECFQGWFLLPKALREPERVNLQGHILHLEKRVGTFQSDPLQETRRRCQKYLVTNQFESSKKTKCANLLRSSRLLYRLGRWQTTGG